MATAGTQLDTWNHSWREFWQRLVPRCEQPGCAHTRSLWRARDSRLPVLLRGRRYCVEGCLEQALFSELSRLGLSARPTPPHRIPLGLLLLSRQQITDEQLRAALETQRAAGHGRLGEWLQRLGFATESQVMAALARQWSCPLLRAQPVSSLSRRIPQIPLTLLESFAMIPVDYIASTSTLHLAFCEGIDYSVLYAIEQMAVCHTEPSMTVPSLVHRHLQLLSEEAARSEVVFEGVSDGAEFSRIVRSYCLRVAASELLLAACGPYIWVRLLRQSRSPLDLLLRWKQ